MITLALRLFAGNVFRNLAGEVIKGWEWIFATPVHILEAALTAALLWGSWQHHDVHVARDALPAWQSAYGTIKGAYLTERGVVQSLTKAIDGQNKAINTFAATQQAKQTAAKQALRQATGRAERLEAVAGRIDAERAQGGSGGQNCRTGKAVLDARGDL